MTPDDLAAIRERDAALGNPRYFAWSNYEETDMFTGTQAIRDRRVLLAHIDAITEAVEGLPWFDPDYRITAMNGTVREPTTPADHVESYRAAVLALLRGTPQREPVCSSPGCGLPERLHGAPPGEPPNPTRSTHHFRGTPQR